jgi:hypothetical protein
VTLNVACQIWPDTKVKESGPKDRLEGALSKAAYGEKGKVAQKDSHTYLKRPLVCGEVPQSARSAT